MHTMNRRIYEARKNANMTQGQVAERLHISTQSVSSWEKGTSFPDIANVAELAALFHVTTDWLLLGKTPGKDILEATANLSDRLFSEARMRTYIGAYCNAKHLFQTARALDYASEKHDGQFRKKGHAEERVPYIYHPLLVTCHALALGLEEDDLLSACLLHDVCEDCGVEPEALPVSDACAEAVRLLTKPKNFEKTAQAEQAYYDAIAANRIATVVKLLDRCSNVSSMATSFTDQHMVAYMQETWDYVMPLLEKARESYPEYANAFFLIRYHMSSVLESLRHHMRSYLETEK